MKQGTTVLALLGVAIISAGLTFVVSQNDATPNLSAPLPKAGSFVNGHITVYLHDENGNLKAFRESDNMISNRGLEVMLKQVFGNSTAASTDGLNTFNITSTGGTLAGTVKTISLGTGGETAALQHQQGLSARVFTGTCANKTMTFKLSDGGANAHPQTGKKLVVVGNTTFSGGGADTCAGSSVDEVGLFTSQTGSSGAMFARQTFSALTIGASDTLTINWDIQFQDT